MNTRAILPLLFKRAAAWCLLASVLLFSSCLDTCLSPRGIGHGSTEPIHIQLHVYETSLRFSIPDKQMDEFVGFSIDRFVEDTRSAGAAETGVSKVISLPESYGFHSFSETDQSHVFTFEGTEESINKIMYEIRKDPDSCKKICAFTYSVEYGSETHHTKVTCVAGTVSRKPDADETIVLFDIVDHR